MFLWALRLFNCYRLGKQNVNKHWSQVGNKISISCRAISIKNKILYIFPKKHFPNEILLYITEISDLRNQML